jgi:galactokinase
VKLHWKSLKVLDKLKNFFKRYFVNVFKFKESKANIDEEAYRRARHAITEIKRTVQSCEALASNDMHKFGLLMNQSHDSLR